MAQKVKITAKCPVCKKKRLFTDPPAHTPYCHDCVVPLIVDKIELFSVKEKSKKNK
jgi:hypothetical protein